MIKNYYLHCLKCSHYIELNGKPDEFKEKYSLYQYPLSQLQAGIPVMENGKTPNAQFFGQLPRFRCPKCGYAITAKRLIPRLSDQNEAKNETNGREDGSLGPQIPPNTPGKSGSFDPKISF